MVKIKKPHQKIITPQEMNATSCQEEHNFSVKYFPAWTLQQRNEGAGHWLDPFRLAEGQKYKSLHRRMKTCGKCQDKRTECRILEGAFLLELHCTDKPSDLCSIHISEHNLNSVKPEELRQFHNVTFIDASINSLSLDSFSSFLSLRELNLSLNGLKHMEFCAAEFPHLQFLDLSYNSVSAGSVASIGRLPRLKVLHLTGNDLRHLPPDMGFSRNEATQLRPPQEEDAGFPALEVLQLDDNRLTSGVFWSIKNLNRLKILNLQGNCISKIPYLLMRGGFKPFTEDFEHVFEERNPDERMRRLTQMCAWDDCQMQAGPSLPLPELQLLNLAHNKITQEEALLAVAVFPAIRELDIRSNPLTTQRTRDPPSLTQCLQDRLGITVKRKSHPLRLSDDLKWKLEHRPIKRFKDGPRPPGGRNAPIKTKPESGNSKGRNDAEEHPERCFLTQVTDIAESAADLQTEGAIPAERKRTHDISGNLRDWELLMDAKPIPKLGIQAAVRMLEHKLRNLDVYKDSRHEVDGIPKRRRRGEKRVLSNAKALPSIKPKNQAVKREEDTRKEIGGSRSMTGVPLGRAIGDAAVGAREALLLLGDMAAKYKKLYRTTMEQAGGVQGHGSRAERL